jgi:type 1 fimbria pilin
MVTLGIFTAVVFTSVRTMAGSELAFTLSLSNCGQGLNCKFQFLLGAGK